MGDPLLSLVMIARDEEAALERSLRSVQPFVDEVIVVDTGSVDGTREVAMAAGARVLSFPWQDDFAAARNECLRYARGLWVLALDADEEVVEGSWLGLRSLLVSTNERRFAVEITNLVGDGSQRERVLVTRLFRRDGHTYVGRVHEQLFYLGNPVPSGPVSGLRITHHGYLSQTLNARNKLQRNLSLLHRCWREGADAYIAYQLGVTYLVAGRPADALPWFDETRRLQGQYSWGVLKHTAQCLRALGRYAEAARLVKQGTVLYPDYTDLHFLLGTLFLDLGCIREAEKAFLACLDLGEAPSPYKTVEGVGSFLAHYNLGVIHEMTGRLGSAVEHYRAAASLGHAPARVRLRAVSASVCDAGWSKRKSR